MGTSTPILATNALRVLWLIQPLVTGPLWASALDDVDTPGRTIISIALWAIWAGGLAATLIPLPVTLTAIRLITTGAAALAVWALVRVSSVRAAEVIGLVAAIAAAIVAMLNFVGDRFVDGSSYGDERRMPLRPPTAVLLGPAPLAWAGAVAGLTIGPALLATGRWIPGAIITVVGLPVAALAIRSLHSLARRFVVFVPAGLVIHDLVAMHDPVLFPRTAVSFVGPALAESEAVDVSAGAIGLLLELSLVAPTKVPVRDDIGPKATEGEPVEVDALLFSPSRPGALLDEAAERKLPVH